MYLHWTHLASYIHLAMAKGYRLSICRSAIIWHFSAEMLQNIQIPFNSEYRTSKYCYLKKLIHLHNSYCYLKKKIIHLSIVVQLTTLVTHIGCDTVTAQDPIYISGQAAAVNRKKMLKCQLCISLFACFPNMVYKCCMVYKY